MIRLDRWNHVYPVGSPFLARGQEGYEQLGRRDRHLHQLEW